MKEQQIFFGSIIATVSAIAFGYFGVQYFTKSTMYAAAGAMLGLSAVAQIIQVKPKFKSLLPEQSISTSVFEISDIKTQQQIQSVPQPIETNIEHSLEMIEPHSHDKWIADNDPIIERFAKLDL